MMCLQRSVSWKGGIKLKSFYVFLVSAFCVLGSMQQGSLAVPVFGNGTLGNFVGDFSYNAIEAELDVSITNTSDVNNGGYITAFAFNNPFDSITGVSFSSSDPDFNLIGGSDFDNSISSMPYGQFDIGASISNAFLGGGQPQKGIGVGDTETFTFSLTGTGTAFSNLNIQDFLGELSIGNSTDKQPGFFIARFRGFNDGGSNKTLGDIPSTVPEPATIALVGIGLAGLACGAVRRRIKRLNSSNTSL